MTFVAKTVNPSQKHKNLQGGSPCDSGNSRNCSELCPGRAATVNGPEGSSPGRSPRPKYTFIMFTTPNDEDRGVFANILLDEWFKRSFKEYGNAKRLMLLFLQALIPEREIAPFAHLQPAATPTESHG